jgi:PRC-barrel domain
MPRPDVNVAMAQPEVQVNQPQPQVQVVQPQQQPQVQVQPARPQVSVQQDANRANVQVQGENQPNVRYERAEPKVVVNQPQGQPQVRVETMAEGQQGRTEGARPQAQQQQTARQSDSGPQVTGAVPGGTPLTVSQLNRLNLYNAQGNELGDVERVVEGPDGKQYVVIGAGGFVGIGEKHVPIPLERAWLCAVIDS